MLSEGLCSVRLYVWVFLVDSHNASESEKSVFFAVTCLVHRLVRRCGRGGAVAWPLGGVGGFVCLSLSLGARSLRMMVTACHS